jgi:hypothetical protein
VTARSRHSAADEFPNALIDGKPADSSVLLGHRAPKLKTEEARARADGLQLAPRGEIEKRHEFVCYRTGHFVSLKFSVTYTYKFWRLEGNENTFNKTTVQALLRSAGIDFCHNQVSKGIDNGQSVTETWDKWQNTTTGNWMPFTDALGVVTNTLFYIKTNVGNTYSEFDCMNSFARIINDCHGGNPDSYVH